MNLNNIFKKILSFVYPKRCVFCYKIIKYDKNICDKCKNSIRGKSKVTNIFCENFSPTVCVSALKYDSSIKSALCRFKFRGVKNYSYQFSEEICISISEHFKSTDFRYVTCVPISKKSLKTRGYNHSELLAKCLAKKLGSKFCNLIEKPKDNLPQHTLSRSERENNVKGVYSIKTDINIRKSDNLLLIDDIITTGSTLKECIKLLKENGFINIYCATLAYRTLN